MNIISYKLQKCKIFSISLFFYSDDLKKKKKDSECFMIIWELLNRSNITLNFIKLLSNLKIIISLYDVIYSSYWSGKTVLDTIYCYLEKCYSHIGI